MSKRAPRPVDKKKEARSRIQQLVPQPRSRPTSDPLAAVERASLIHLLSLSTPKNGSRYQTLATLSDRIDHHDLTHDREWTDADTAEISALVAQYSSLRAESVQTCNNRTRILLFGVPAIGALTGGALTISDPKSSRALITAVFSYAIPIICILILLVWAGEAMRSHRLGYFIASEVEARINAKLKRFVLSWEAALWCRRIPRDELFGPSMMALAVIGIISAASPIFGYILAEYSWEGYRDPLVVLFCPYAMLVTSAIYVYLQMPQLQNKDQIQSPWFSRTDD